MSMRITISEPFRCIGRSISGYNSALNTRQKVTATALQIFCGLLLFRSLFFDFSLSLISSLAIAGGITLTVLFIQTILIGYDINQIIKRGPNVDRYQNAINLIS